MPNTSNGSLEKSLDLSEEEKQERIYRLRKLINEEDFLKGFLFDDDYLERYLYGADFDVEESLKTIVFFYRLVKQYPDWFPKYGPLSKKSLIDMDLRIAIPACDKEGRPIHIVKLGNVDMNIVTLFDTIQMDDIWLEHVLSLDPKVTGKGLCVILDIENYPWRMIKWSTPENTRLSVKKMQALPFKEFRFHIVNNSFLINATIRCIWPFLTESIKKMVKFHFGDRESLYKHIDQEVLPVEYGGQMQYNYKDIYQKLYDRNDEIIRKLERYRTFK